MALQINRWFIGVLLIMAIVFPTVFVIPKLFFLFGAVLCTVIALITGQAKINKRWTLVTLLYMILGVGASVHGVIVGAPGAVRVLSVMALYPAIFLLLAFTYKNSDAERFFNVLVLASWLLIIVDLAYVLSNLYFPGNAYVMYLESIYQEGAVIDSDDSYYKFTVPNISSLLFLLPFFFCALISGEKNKSQINLALICFFFTVIAIISGRRALFVSFFAGPILMYLIGAGRNQARLAKNEVSKKKIFFLTSVISAAIFYFLIKLDFFEFYASQISTIFDFEKNSSNQERSLQFDSLMDGVLNAPFFGNGAGAATNYIRSETQPWAYELSYAALMFQYGIIGFSIYSAGIFYLILKMRKVAIERIDGGFAAFYLAGLLSFLVANATNPYLAKFDYMWVIFIPVAMVMARKRGLND